MVNLQLLIEGEQIELHDDESVTLTQALQDVLDLQKVFTDYTRTFNVPASKRNNKIFKHFYNPAITGFDVRQKKAAELLINYKTFKTGRIKLESVQMSNNHPVNYRITFFGNTIRIKEIFRDNTLQDLVSLDYQIVYTFANVKTQMQKGQDLVFGGDDIEDAIIYPLITHTDRLTYDSGTDIADSANLHVTATSKGLKFDQLKPALKIHAIIKAIQQEYNINFSDDFFNLDNEAYSKLYVWLHKQKGRFINVEDEAAFRSFPTQWSDYIGNDYNILNGFLASDGTGYENIGHTQGERLMTLSVTTTSEVTYTLRVSQNKTVIHEQEYTTNGTDDIITLADNLQLQQSRIINGQGQHSTYKVEIKTSAAVDISVRMSIIQKNLYSDASIVSASNTLPSNANLYSTNVSSNLPKIKIIDFLTNLFKMFNLVAYYENDVIEVKPLDDWYEESTATYDVTKYLDLSQGEVSNSFPYNNVNYTYSTDSYLAYYHNEMFGRVWGALSYENDADYTSQEYKVELPFEHMKFERLYNANSDAATDIQWGWMVDSNSDSLIGNPLLFYAKRVTTGTSLSLIEETGASVNSITKYYIPTNTVDASTTTQSLHFGTEQNEYTLASSNKSIFKTYYENYIKEVFDPARKIFKYTAYLPLSILTNIKLNDKVIVFNELFKINKIVTNFQNNRTQLELINETQDYTISNDVIVKDIVKTVDSGVGTADMTTVRADNTILLL